MVVKYEDAEEFVYDLVISYSAEDIELAREVERVASNMNLNCFMIDMSNGDSNPCCWNIRFREAMFYARYFVPLLTINYLRQL